MPLRDILPSAGIWNNTPVVPLPATKLKIDGRDIIAYIDWTLVTTVWRVYTDEAWKVVSISTARVREILLSQGLIDKDKDITVI